MNQLDKPIDLKSLPRNRARVEIIDNRGQLVLPKNRRTNGATKSK